MSAQYSSHKSEPKTIRGQAIGAKPDIFKGPSLRSNVWKIHEVWSSNGQTTFVSSQVSTHTWEGGGGGVLIGGGTSMDVVKTHVVTIFTTHHASGFKNDHQTHTMRAVQSHLCCFRPSRLRPGPRTPPAPTPERSAGSCAPPETNFQRRVSVFTCG